MHPLLAELHFGSVTLPLHTYGFLIAVGFLAGIFTVRHLAKKSGLDPDKVSDLAFWLLIWGFVGARLLFIITRLQFFIDNPADIVRVWEGGLVFFGGLIAATIYAIIYFVRTKISPWLMIDILSPGLVIAHAIGRLGCIAAGCCYGRPTNGNWGFRFESELVDPALRGIPLHPTQLYEATSLTILYLGMLYIFKNKRFDGQVGLTYFMLYPIIRSVVEIYRGDTVRGFIIDGLLSTSQFISIIVFFAALIVLVRRLKQADLTQSP